MINIKISTLSQFDPKDVGEALANGDPDDFARVLRAFFDTASSSRARRHLAEFAAACTNYALPDYIDKLDRMVSYHDYKQKEKTS